MKKVVFLLVTCYLLLVTCSAVLAQEEEGELSSTPKPTPKSKVDEIKEKIASTVAELNLVSKKAFIGEATKLEKNQLTIERNDDPRLIDIDELTKYFTVGKAGKHEEISFSDIKLGNMLVAIGLYNKDSRKLLARIIVLKEIPVNIIGVVREVDIKDGTITVGDKKRNKTFLVDVEKTTKISMYIMEDGVVKSGLSKIEIGQRAHVNGKANSEEENRITASRILILPGKAVGITSPTSGANKEATQSGTPTPTTKPTATPKPTKKPTSTPTPSE